MHSSYSIHATCHTRISHMYLKKGWQNQRNMNM
jgi:hypothetical protein